MPVGIALVFEMTAPVFIALYVWLVRKEQVRSRLWLALLLSLSGLVFVARGLAGRRDRWTRSGVGAALIAALCLATYYLMGERGTVTRDPVALTCWSFVAAARVLGGRRAVVAVRRGVLGRAGADVDRLASSCRCGCSSRGSSSSARWCRSGCPSPRCATSRRPPPGWSRRSSRCSPRSSRGCGSSRCSPAGRWRAASSSSPGSSLAQTARATPVPTSLPETPGAAVELTGIGTRSGHRADAAGTPGGRPCGDRCPPPEVPVTTSPVVRCCDPPVRSSRGRRRREERRLWLCLR